MTDLTRLCTLCLKDSSDMHAFENYTVLILFYRLCIHSEKKLCKLFLNLLYIFSYSTEPQARGPPGRFVKDTYESQKERFLQENQSGDSSLEEWIVSDGELTSEDSGTEDSLSSDDTIVEVSAVYLRLIALHAGNHRWTVSKTCRNNKQSSYSQTSLSYSFVYSHGLANIYNCHQM